MGTLLLLDIPKVPSDSTIQELLKSVFGMLGMKNLTRLDSDHMCEDKAHKEYVCLLCIPGKIPEIFCAIIW